MLFWNFTPLVTWRFRMSRHGMIRMVNMSCSIPTHEILQQPQSDPLREIERALEPVQQADRADVHALLVQELQRLHEGVLARYGLRPSELAAWKAAQQLP